MTAHTETSIPLKATVALDVESTLADINAPFLEIYNDRYGTDHHRHEIDSWEWVIDELEDGEYMAITEENWRYRPLDIPPCELALGWTIEKLARIARVDVVTARTGVDEEIIDWMAYHGIHQGEHYDEFVAVHRDETKADLGYEVFIDDKPGLADELHFEQVQLLPVRSYNRGAIDHGKVIPVGSVSEAVSILELVPYLRDSSHTGISDVDELQSSIRKQLGSFPQRI